MKFKRNVLLLAVAFLAIAPSMLLRSQLHSLGPIPAALISGLAIMAAAFILLWACDAAQKDISQALSIAIVALMAVLPEFSVDMYFTWQAGQFPLGNYAHYAVANMTGANRLIIGLAWFVVTLIQYMKNKEQLSLDPEQMTEIKFLGIATLYAFFISVKGSLCWYDGIFFIGLYIVYIKIISGRPASDEEIGGPAELITVLPTKYRRLATAVLFIISGATILLNAENFSESLILSGKMLGINEFVLVQWLAPIASETPEFVVAIMLALRGKGGIALGSLLAAKLNQWSLLVGMIPGVYALSAKTLAHPIPFSSFQIHEILLTAAQSILAVVMLVDLKFSIRHASLLFTLFVGQLVSPLIIQSMPQSSWFGFHDFQMHQLFTFLYLISAIVIKIDSPESIYKFLPGFKDKKNG